ncbi:hypothetical protein AYO47_00030 [Planctomyces sp. SCGC AG-212-M04]|nr:hypothetical protein AYO47_00030 [Planctomyces sp. SCGC AG-212-M04]
MADGVPPFDVEYLRAAIAVAPALLASIMLLMVVFRLKRAGHLRTSDRLLISASILLVLASLPWCRFYIDL